MHLTSPRLAGAVALVFGAILVPVASASASTVCTPGPPTCDFADIQSAVNAAAPGDTIEVATGTYTAAVIDKPLTLEGAQVGSDGRPRTPLSPLETVVNGGPSGGFDVKASHVRIDGFTFTNGVPGVQLRPGTSDNTVVNNVFYQNIFGIYAHSDGQDPTLIRHNKFERNNVTGPSSGNGVYADQGVGRLTVDANDFLGNENAGVLIADVVPSVGTRNHDIKITNNFAGVSTSSPTPLQNGIFAAVTKSRDVLVKGNTAVSLAGAGVYLEADKNVDVLNNDISGLGDGFSAIRLKTQNFFATAVPNEDVTVVGNNIHDNDLGPSHPTFGINVQDGAILGPLEVHFNRIVGNDVGINNDDVDDPVDAENNWWGCNAGPNQPGCDTVTSGPPPFFNGPPPVVDFDPWLVLSVSSKKQLLDLNGDTSKITADLRGNSEGDEFDAPPVPDGVTTFATTLGTLNPLSDLMHLGSAFSELTSGATPGTADVSATRDNQTVTTPVDIHAPVAGPTGPGGPTGPAGPNGTNGTNGTNGVNGVDGPVGPVGPQGPAAPTIAPSEGPDNRVVGCSITAPASSPALRGSVTVSAICEEAVRYAASATVAVPFTGGTVGSKARRFKVRVVRTGLVKAAKTKNLRLVLGDGLLRAARRGLEHGRRSTARVKVVATDRAGNTKLMRVTVRLR